MPKLIQGRDFHGWAWEIVTGELFVPSFSFLKPNYGMGMPGRWVRVKCVVVEPKLKKKAKVRK